MSNAVSKRSLFDACEGAMEKAEDTYKAWTPHGYSMRVAPESFVQMVIAQELHSADSGVRLLLEASVAELLKSCDEKTSKNTRTGRIDIVVYYKSKSPRLLVEVKKITKKNSLNEDLKRVLELMSKCKTIQNGVLIGYGARASEDKLKGLFDGVEEELKEQFIGKYEGYRLSCARKVALNDVPTRGGARNLNAVVYKISRPKISRNT